MVIDQIIISALFLWLMGCLVFTDWPAAYLFTCTMLISYFAAPVNKYALLGKASNTGLVTLILL